MLPKYQTGKRIKTEAELQLERWLKQSTGPIRGDNTTVVLNTPTRPVTLAPSLPVAETQNQASSAIARKNELETERIRRANAIAASNNSKGLIEGFQNSAVGDKMKIFSDDLDSYINPLAFFGEAFVDPLGHAFRPETSNLDRILAVAGPLTMGAFGKMAKASNPIQKIINRGKFVTSSMNPVGKVMTPLIYGSNLLNKDLENSPKFTDAEIEAMFDN